MCTNIEILTQTLQVLNSLVDSTVILLSIQQSFVKDHSSIEPKQETKQVNNEPELVPFEPFNFTNLHFFPFKIKYDKTLERNNCFKPSKSMLDSLVVKLKDYLSPQPSTSKALVARNPMTISYIFRINLIEMYKLFNSIRKLIKTFQIKSLKTKPKRLNILIKRQPIRVSPVLMSSFNLILVSEWFQQTTLVKFQSSLLKKKPTTTKVMQLKPKLKTPLTEKTIPKSVDFNDFKIIQHLEPNKNPTQMDVKYFTFQLMEPTQIDTQRSLYEFNFERTQTSEYSQSQACLSQEKYPINNWNNSQLEEENDIDSSQKIESALSISPEISSYQQAESIAYSPLCTPSPEKIIEQTKCHVTSDTIYIDFKPVKYDPPLVKINCSQIMANDLVAVESQVLSEATFVKKPAKRRIFMKHGLSKSQRIRKPLHTHYLKN